MAYADEEARIGVGRAHRLFVKVETTPGTAVVPASTDLVLSTSQHIPEQDYEYIDDAQKRNTRSAGQRIKMKFGVGKMTFSAYLKAPGGSGPVDPELVDVLTGLFGTKSVSTGNSTSTASCATVTIKLASGGAANFATGQAVCVDVSAGATPQYEVAWITGISSDDLTVAPPLTLAPATGKVVYGSTNFYPANSPSSYTIYAEETDFAGSTGGVKVLAGCRFGKGTFKVNAKDPASADFDVSYSKMMRVGRDALNGTCVTAAISMVVQDASKFEANTYVLIDSESILITGVTIGTNTLAITRAANSTSAAQHADGAVVIPWLPAGTEVGSPVPGYLGRCRMGDSVQNVLDATVSIDQKPMFVNEKDDTIYPNANAIYPERREVTVDTNIYYTNDSQKFAYMAGAQSTQQLMIPAGSTPGSIVALYVPQFDTNYPKLSGDNEQQLALTGKPFATSAGNDEVKLAFIFGT